MVFSKFESFSVRPPTPPKDLKEINAALQFLDDPFGTKPPPTTSSKTAKSSLNTPEQSPSSELGDPLSSSSRKKRVNFELRTCSIPVKDGLTAQPWTPRHSSPLRPLPQTRVSKPLKSILKASDPTSTPPPTDEGAAAHKFQSFAEMLESVVKMLAQGARPSKLDAYISMQRTMQAYEKLPDTQAMSNKMGLFSQFIRRDMQAIGISGNGPDSQLIGQALKFLMALVRIPELKSAMDDDFCSFVVDRIIAVATDAAMPKAIINTHLALLMQQNFRPRTMTVARVEKIIDALDTVHERVTGYSIQAYRIRVYKKLMQQRPETMIKHTERWFKHILKAMLSAQKDIHQAALDTAIYAAKTIGSDRHVTKSVVSILNRIKTEGDTVGKIFAQELEKSLDSESAPLVPQIWGALTAFLQDSIHESTFSATREWLMVLEKFLKPENEGVRVYVNVAFGFLVYAVNLRQETTLDWSKMLREISQHQLRRSQARKSDVDIATSGYLTLLYYAFQPTAPHTQLDRYWGEFVVDFWKSLIYSPSGKPAVRQAVAACRVASALFIGSRKPWNEQRALELKPQLMVHLGELPLLDPKWVRRSLATVLQFVETLLDVLPMAPNGADEDLIRTMWTALLDSLVEASSKEIMASSETKDAIAHIVNMLRRMWDRHTAQYAESPRDSWEDKYCFLIETVVQKLGAFQFADKCLTRNGEDQFQVASTPSHRSRQQGPRVSPLLYLIQLLVSRSEGKLSNTVRLRVVQLILEPCLGAQNTRLGKLELLRDCAASVHPTSRNEVETSFLIRVATLTQSCIQENPSDSNERISRRLGKEYEVVVEILALGSSDLMKTSCGQELLSSFVDVVRQEAGEGAVVLAVFEKVSQSILTKVSKEDYKSCLPYASILLVNLPKTIIRRSLEQGRQTLYPSSPGPARGQEFDPYSHLYTAIVSIGSAAYESLDETDTEDTRQFLAAFAASIEQGPSSLLAVYLRKTQQYIKLWIEDPDKKLQKKDQSIKQLHRQVVSLWGAVNNAIEKLPRKDSSILVTLDPLITAGFLSRRRKIVNISIKTWNVTFGKEESLRYPARLETALQRLRGVVELSLPSLEDRDVGSDEQPSFYESDSTPEDTPRGKPSLRVKESSFRNMKSGKNPISPALSSAGSRKRSSRRTPKGKLPHEDSQMVFEEIISSPSNLFDQESQILTERQKEMIERQRITSNIFSGIGSRRNSQPDFLSPKAMAQELHSEAISADESANGGSRTPSKALAAMGPMDIYLGSSPTPQSRNRSQQILSDDPSVTTPSAVRTVQLADKLEELGSSPPRFEKGTASIADVRKSNEAPPIVVGDSFDNRQPENPHTGFFDDGTTVEDGLFPVTDNYDPLLDAQTLDDELPTDTDSVDVPSSTVELQLNAQLNAELNAQTESSTRLEGLKESHDVYVDASSQPSSVAIEKPDAIKNTQMEELQPTHTNLAVDGRGTGTPSSTSRVRDSFSSINAEEEVADEPSSAAQNPRRSSRHSAASSPALKLSSDRKRKQSPAGVISRNKKSKKNNLKIESPSPVTHKPKEPILLDCIVVASDTPKPSRKRRSKSISQSPTSSQSIVPETNRKLSTHRSASLLSHVEAALDDIFVQDTPPSKRVRRGVNQDVSEAKTTPQEHSNTSKAKRLSHVQVTPRHSSTRTSLTAAPEKGKIISAETPAHGTQVPTSNQQEVDVTSHLRHDMAAPMGTVQSLSQQASIEAATPSRSFAERVILTPKSLLGRLRRMISDCSQLVGLGREEERQLDDALFHLRRQVHAAGMRGQEGQE